MFQKEYGNKWKGKRKVLFRKDNGFNPDVKGYFVYRSVQKRSVIGRSVIRRYALRASRIGLVFVLTFFLLLLGFPQGVKAVRADSAVYDPQAEHLIVQYVQGTNLRSLAEACGGELVRIGPLDYCTLQFNKEDLNNNDPGTYQAKKKEIEDRVLLAEGVLGVHWSKKFKIDALKHENYRQIENNEIEKKIAETANKYSISIEDPEYSSQWAIKKIRADQVWEEGITGKDVIVAVVDTGIDLDHPDFVDPERNKNNIVPGYNAITRSALPSAAQDDNGHGTAVAGVIAALNNNKGIVGVAYDAKIMPIKAMDANGEGEDSVIADGIIWAVKQGAKIINLSIGSDEHDKILEDALQYAADRGCLLVAASGNKQGYTDLQAMQTQGLTRNQVAYPGANPNVIAVSALDNNDNIAEFSLTGPEVALSAPGKKVLTDYWGKARRGCAYSTGTSIAAPFVSASAALLWSKYPDLSAAEIRQALEASACDLGEEGRDDCYGYGRVDVYRALKYLEEPKKYLASADLGWEGGRIYIRNINEEADAMLTVSPGTFCPPQDPNGDQGKIRVDLQAVEAPGDFPASIIPTGEAFSISSWGEVSPRKVLKLRVKLFYPLEKAPADKESSTFNPAESSLLLERDEAAIAHLYKWSGCRWIRVGGGASHSDRNMEVSIYEPGTYMVGWSREALPERICGSDRITTAIEIAHMAFPTGADTVIVARADDFPDALAGAPLAYKYHAPILLTPSDDIPLEVYWTIKKLAPREIIILGGYEAVSASAEGRLGDLAHVSRIAGSDRQATANAVAEILGTRGQAVIVDCANFPDAIVAAAHASIEGKPILLSTSSNLGGETDRLLRKLSVIEAEVIGGSEAISDSIYKKLPNPKRLGGFDRFSTSAGVIAANKPAGQVLYIATGMNFPDALTGGILAAANSTNILLIPEDGPTESQAYLLSNLKGKKLIILGGEGAIPDVALKRIQVLINR